MKSSFLKDLKIKLFITVLFVSLTCDFTIVHAQGFETELLKTGRIWAVASATGHGQASVSPTAGWFPADFNICAYGGNEGNVGARAITIYLRNYQFSADSVIEKLE